MSEKTENKSAQWIPGREILASSAIRSDEPKTIGTQATDNFRRNFVPRAELERVTAERDEARMIKDIIAVQNTRDRDDLATQILLRKQTEKERDELRAELERVRKQTFTCFQCGDGNTPLYCLNCAGDVLQTELERVRKQAAAMQSAGLALIRAVENRSSFLYPHIEEIRKVCISDSAGSDYIHRDKVKPLIDALEMSANYVLWEGSDAECKQMESARIHAKMLCQ